MDKEFTKYLLFLSREMVNCDKTRKINSYLPYNYSQIIVKSLNDINKIDLNLEMDGKNLIDYINQERLYIIENNDLVDVVNTNKNIGSDMFIYHFMNISNILKKIDV